MTVQSPQPHSDSIAPVFARLVASEGTLSHPYCRAAIDRTPESFARNSGDFADAVHYLSLLHGQMPGIIDHAARHIIDNAARGWLLSAVAGFAEERGHIARLVVAVGPLPSTSGQQNMTTIISQQRRALEMLAQSDRRGCALGSSMALVLDWEPVRTIMTSGAARLGIDMPACSLPGIADTVATLAAVEAEFPISRAAQFGASQLLVQHRTIWDLLEARASLRRSADQH